MTIFFTEQKLQKRLDELFLSIHREILQIPTFKYVEEDVSSAHDPRYDDSGWEDFRVGDYWGGYDKVAWFRTTVSVPQGWANKKLALRFLTGPRDGGGSTAEALLYVNGQPLQGIDVWHEVAVLPPCALEASEIHIALRVWSGVLNVPARRHFRLAQLVVIDEATEALYHMGDVALKSVKALDANDLSRCRLLELLNEGFNLIDFLYPKSEQFYNSIAMARKRLETGLRKLETTEAKPTITCIGHSHIDMAWLWRLSHSREKASRTFSTVLNLMRQFPEYRFMHSSPQLYKYLKSDYPEIFAEVKKRIAAGEWEITGGMWVEADTNVPSGESLIRQIMYGKQFIREEFGQDSKVVWLPDVFGYSWALPQIIKGSGMEYFMTTKISWSQYNRFPYDTFSWRGIDGTELLTHFMSVPEGGSNQNQYTYNGVIDPIVVKDTWNAYQQKGMNNELLLAYGWGDGGGGPTKEMLESAKYMNNIPGIPRVRLGKVEPYFAQLAAGLKDKNVPIWDGELYLEYHRGTYTSQAFIKRENRKAEILYHDAELWASVAVLLLGKAYPHNTLRTGWELILLNQFHDILPGTSIRQVYEDCKQDYQEIRDIGAAALETCIQQVTNAICVVDDSLVVFNSLAWNRADVLTYPIGGRLTADSTVLTANGEQALSQVVVEHGREYLLVEVDEVPSLGYKAFPIVESARNEGSEVKVTPNLLENRFFRIELNPNGQLGRVFDKQARREVLPKGAKANVFQAFEDKPLNFDAWDIDIFYQEKMRELDHLVEAVIEEEGPIRGVLRLTWAFGRSKITQRMMVYRNIPRIDFKTDVDWQESQVLLKVAFPVAIRSTKATYEIQFGHMERPTHWNTSWDWARFESVGHKWVDLSEGNYGASLLNDCKYGHDIKDNVLRLTLIKSPLSPDETADKGRHSFTYSLYPHQGSIQQSETIKEAYELNMPLAAVVKPGSSHGTLPSTFSLATVDQPHVVIETVKQAEKDGAIVFRVYDTKQYRTEEVVLSFGRPVIKVVACNLIEEEDQPLPITKNRITFSLEPFQIKTFKVYFQEGGLTSS